MGAIIDNKEEASYRDRLATVDAKGRRKWIFAKAPNGKLTSYRRILAYFLLLILFGTPFLKVEGEPLLLFNVIERKFIIFGAQFFPQDFHLAFLAMITLLVFIILFTVVFGRLWCGWACPQTIFMEFIYRQIEYWIEGNPAAQKKLKSQEWNTEKLVKKGSKHAIFYGIAFLISNVFLSYIIGVDQLKEIITDNPANHVAGLTAMIIFSGVFYFVFAFFREQVCTLVCPYGRLQGVLLDSNSIAVTYDFKRGEERGRFRKNENREEVKKGDCIDCRRCVQVCPTGIDIRDGNQLECINCTACIDECNTVMASVEMPTGLIRFDSQKGVETGQKFKFTARNIAYMVVLGVLIIIFSTLLLTKSKVESIIVRTYNTVYQEQPNNQISNMYNYKFVNKTNDTMPIQIKMLSHSGTIKLVGSNQITVKGGEIREGVFFVIIDRDKINSKAEIELGIYSGPEKIEDVKLSFIGPF